jgi:hypothetical protein
LLERNRPPQITPDSLRLVRKLVRGDVPWSSRHLRVAHAVCLLGRIRRSFLDRVHAIEVEGNVIDDLGDGRVRSPVGPNGVYRLLSPGWDAVIAALSLVRTVGGVVRRFKQRQVDVVEWDVVDRLVIRLMELQRVLSVGDDSPSNRDDDPLRGRLDRDLVIRSGCLGLRRADERRGRRPAVPQSPHRRVAPGQGLRQARDQLPQGARLGTVGDRKPRIRLAPDALRLHAQTMEFSGEAAQARMHPGSSTKSEHSPRQTRSLRTRRCLREQPFRRVPSQGRAWTYRGPRHHGTRRLEVMLGPFQCAFGTCDLEIGTKSSRSPRGRRRSANKKAPHQQGFLK